MLADHYKYCFWTATGELDCSGMAGSIDLSKRPKLNTFCQSLDPPPKCINCAPSRSPYDGPSNFKFNKEQYSGYQTSPGPGQCLRSKQGKRCIPLSGPQIAQAGFSEKGLYVSPTYNQPPRDSDHPRNQYYQTGGNQSLGRHNLNELPCGLQPRPSLPQPQIQSLLKHPPLYPSQYVGRLKNDQGLLQEHPSQQLQSSQFQQRAGGYQPHASNIYASNPYNPTYLTTPPPTQCQGRYPTKYPIHPPKGKIRYYQSKIPSFMYKRRKPDLRYRANLQNLNGQQLYENLINNYNRDGLYDQTDMNYNYQMTQHFRNQAKNVGYRQDQNQITNSANNQAIIPYQSGGADATYDGVSTPQSYAPTAGPFPSQWHNDLQNGNFQNADFQNGYKRITPFYEQDSNPNLSLREDANISCPSYQQLLARDNISLQSQNNNQALVPATETPILSYSQMSPASVQLRPFSPWMRYEAHSPMTYQKKYLKWLPKFRSKLRVLTRELGAPNLIDRDSGFALWNESALKNVYYGIFKRIELHNEEIKCDKPYPHSGNVYAWIRMDVPVEEHTKLHLISPSLVYDRPKKWLRVRSQSLNGNLSLLTLVCLYLKRKLTYYNIERYQLQKKYLWAIVPKSTFYYPKAKETFIKIIKDSIC